MSRTVRYWIPCNFNAKHAAQDTQIGAMLGRVGTTWPSQGVLQREVGVLAQPSDGELYSCRMSVWVAEKAQSKSRAQHRVMCMCPGCYKTMSVGRISQHACKGLVKS